MLIGRYLFQHEKNTYITVKKVFFSYGGVFSIQLCVGVLFLTYVNANTTTQLYVSTSVIRNMQLGRTAS